MAQLYLDTIHTPDALNQFSKLLDSCFPVPKGSHFFDDFPIWDFRHNIPSLLRLGIFNGTQLVSSTAVRKAELKGLNDIRIPVAILGAVATHPDWRGKGLASRTVEAAVEWATQEKAELVLLWGSEHALYQRLGFQLCGEQIQIPLDQIPMETHSNEQLCKGWNPGIFSWMKKRRGGLALKESDLAWIESHKNVEWYYTGTPDHPTSYAAYGRGIDLNGMVHEWGGRPESLFALLKSLCKQKPGSVLLGSPSQLDFMGIPYDSKQIEFLCMARALDPKRTLTDMKWLWVWGLDAA